MVSSFVRICTKTCLLVLIAVTRIIPTITYSLIWGERHIDYDETMVSLRKLQRLKKSNFTLKDRQLPSVGDVWIAKNMAGSEYYKPQFKIKCCQRQAPAYFTCIDTNMLLKLHLTVN